MVRELEVGAGREEDLLEALRSRRALRLTLLGAPSLPRLTLLAAAAAFEAPLLVRFEEDLGSPLAELACLSLASCFPERARLDLNGALLGPVAARVGWRSLARLLAWHGPRVPAAAVLSMPRPPDTHRSPLALAAATEVLGAPVRGRAVPFARELALFGLVLSAPDRVEGVRAFRERRRPEFDW